MRRIRLIGMVLSEAGIRPIRFAQALLGIPVYLRNLLEIYRSNNGQWEISLFPVLADRYEQSGSASSQYFLMDLWAARIIYRVAPEHIVDIGSRVDGFVAHILSFREIEVIDVRPLKSEVDGLMFRQVDMTKLNAAPEVYADCVTSLHALEHFGLGRYGDSVNVNGWKIGLCNMARMLKIGGNLILAVPVGVERIEFDAHRIFRPDTIIEEARSNGLELVAYSYIDDQKQFHQEGSIECSGTLDYGCGCFHFVRSVAGHNALAEN